MKKGSQAAGMAAVLDKVQKGITEHGWFAISTAQGTPGGVAFTYSVGFQATWGIPDLVIMGMPTDAAKSYLNKAAAEARAGRGLALPGHLPGFFGDYDGWALAVGQESFDEHFRIAGALYPRHTRALQLVFPDVAGRFPWDAISQYHGQVPLLGPPPALN